MGTGPTTIHSDGEALHVWKIWLSLSGPWFLNQ